MIGSKCTCAFARGYTLVFLIVQKTMAPLKFNFIFKQYIEIYKFKG